MEMMSPLWVDPDGVNMFGTPVRHLFSTASYLRSGFCICSPFDLPLHIENKTTGSEGDRQIEREKKGCGAIYRGREREKEEAKSELAYRDRHRETHREREIRKR